MTRLRDDGQTAADDEEISRRLSHFIKLKVTTIGENCNNVTLHRRASCWQANEERNVKSELLARRGSAATDRAECVCR